MTDDHPKRRSAREKILRFAKENRPSLDLPCDPETGHFVDDPDAHLAGLLDTYAHELAERIRAAARADEGDLNADGYGSHGNVLDAADLIDPEVRP